MKSSTAPRMSQRLKRLLSQLNRPQLLKQVLTRDTAILLLLLLLALALKLCHR